MCDFRKTGGIRAGIAMLSSRTGVMNQELARI